MNTTAVTGNIGKDATLRQIGSTQYACFSVADTRKFTDQNGQQQERTTWFSCMKADPSGKLTPYLTKGLKVTVMGSISLEKYQGTDGQMHTYINMMANGVDFITPRDNTQPAPQQRPAPQPQRPPQNVKDLYDYATGGQAHNVRQNAPQTPNQQDDDFPF